MDGALTTRVLMPWRWNPSSRIPSRSTSLRGFSWIHTRAMGYFVASIGRTVVVASQHMRRDRASDAGAVSNALQDALNGARGHTDGVIDRKVVIYQRAYTIGEGNDTAL